MFCLTIQKFLKSVELCEFLLSILEKLTLSKKTWKRNIFVLLQAQYY